MAAGGGENPEQTDMRRRRLEEVHLEVKHLQVRLVQVQEQLKAAAAGGERGAAAI